MIRPSPRAGWARLTFAELYCAQVGCGPQEFRRKIFWRVLHRHAIPVAPLLLPGRYFASDCALIDACGRATRLDQIYEEVREYPFDPQNRRWLRRRAKIRISTQRLVRVAEQCLGRSEIPPVEKRLKE